MSGSTFPIMTRWNDHRPDKIICVPSELIQVHGEQCMRNHDQSWATLAHRGGLTACEAVAVIEDRPWTKMSDADAEKRLRELVAAWKPIT